MPFKLFHKRHLMRMDILQCKTVHSTFLGVKAYGDPLHASNIIDSAFLFKIGKGNVSG